MDPNFGRHVAGGLIAFILIVCGIAAAVGGLIGWLIGRLL